MSSSAASYAAARTVSSYLVIKRGPPFTGANRRRRRALQTSAPRPCPPPSRGAPCFKCGSGALPGPICRNFERILRLTFHSRPRDERRDHTSRTIHERSERWRQDALEMARYALRPGRGSGDRSSPREALEDPCDLALPAGFADGDLLLFLDRLESLLELGGEEGLRGEVGRVHRVSH